MQRMSVEQQAVLNSNAPHKRVIASAGSGKTRLVVGQISEWMHQGAAPESTVAITFTRRAGEELRRRLRAEHDVSLGYVGTVHGMAYLALWMNGEKLTPLADDELVAVVEHVAEVSRLRSSICPKVIKTAKGDSVSNMKPQEFALARAVERYMTTNELVHVGQFVNRFGARLMMDDDLLAWVRARTRTVLWDEFQDVNDADATVLELLQPTRSLVVGDPAQAIFGFRGSSDSHLWKCTGEAFSLSFNYRSRPNVLAVANRLRHKTNQLVAMRTDGPGIVRTFDVSDPYALGDAALDAVRDAAWVGQLPVHVLCRSNLEVAAVRDRLAAANMSVTVASPNFDPYAERPWTDLYMMVRHVCAPKCEWLETKVRSFGVSGTQLWDVDPTRDTARSVLRRVSPEDAASLPHGVADMPALDFAAWYQRRDLEDLMPESGQADVVVMTAHASKGLEFDSVVVAGLGHSMGRDMNDREEGNLVYVACTRAKNELALVGDPAYTANLTD